MIHNESKKKHNFFYALFGNKKSVLHLCSPKAQGKREFSSVGSEHLPYKQRVGGSNPSTPTVASDFSEAFFVPKIHNCISSRGSGRCDDSFRIAKPRTAQTHGSLRFFSGFFCAQNSILYFKQRVGAMRRLASNRETSLGSTLTVVKLHNQYIMRLFSFLAKPLKILV